MITRRPSSSNPRSIRLLGVSGRKMPPNVSTKAGTPASPRDTLQPHGRNFPVHIFMICASTTPSVKITCGAQKFFALKVFYSLHTYNPGPKMNEEKAASIQLDSSYNLHKDNAKSGNSSHLEDLVQAASEMGRCHLAIVQCD